MRWADQEAPTSADWWRVLAIDDIARRVMFLDEETAEAFAQYLLATTTPLVVLERWRNDARIDYRVVVSP